MRPNALFPLTDEMTITDKFHAVHVAAAQAEAPDLSWHDKLAEPDPETSARNFGTNYMKFWTAMEHKFKHRVCLMLAKFPELNFALT